MASKDTTHPALTTPHDQIRWATDPWWKRPAGRTAAGVALTIAVTAGAAFAFAEKIGASPRLAENRECGIVTIASGDTVWGVATANHLDLDDIAALNPHIPDINKVWPGDEIVVGCPAPEVMLAPAAYVVNPDVLEQWSEEREGGRATQRAILAELYQAGARGNALVTLAAITEGESGRAVDALGDTTITDDVWGPSVGPWQIRTVKAETGKGTLRDIEHASTFEGGAQSAVDLWEQTIREGRDPGRPWTAYLKGWHTPHLAAYEALALEMGVLS